MSDILNMINKFFKMNKVTYTTSFIGQCKINYFNKITPSNKDALDNKLYQTLRLIAKKKIIQNGLEDFSLYFMEYQYLVNLWAAHFILEENPTDELKEECLKIITRYTETDYEKLAQEERTWLIEHGYGDRIPKIT
jgi:hypothetical protein